MVDSRDATYERMTRAEVIGRLRALAMHGKPSALDENPLAAWREACGTAAALLSETSATDGSRLRAKEPLPPEVLAGALQDKIETGSERTRPAVAARSASVASVLATPTLTDKNGDDLYPPRICNWITEAAKRISELEGEVEWLREGWINADKITLAERVASARSASEPMTKEERIAYEWALNTPHQSVSARYAKVLAERMRRSDRTGADHG